MTQARTRQSLQGVERRWSVRSLFATLSGQCIAAAGLVLLAGCNEKPHSERMNVLLVTLDTTRADYLGAYGHPGEITPNFDALAREGTRFDLAMSAAAVTPVSHASILSGEYPMQHGLRVLSAAGGFRLRDDVPTLSTVLKKQGYHTAAIHSAYPVSAHFGFDRGFDVFESFDSGLEAGPDQHGWDVNKEQRRSDETTDLALEYLKKADEPFFLWLHYWDPHDAARVPPPEFMPADVPHNELGQPLPSIPLYSAEVHYLDYEFGRLLAALRASGQYEHTLIVVVADHGEGLGDHGWQHHRILFQEQIRVPLFMRVPGVRQAPSVPALVRTIDIFPTVLDYLALTPAPRVRGETLRGLIEGRAEPERSAYADQLNELDLNDRNRNTPFYDFLFCAMDAHWKLVYHPTKPEASELYHIDEDPRETLNLVRSRPEEVVRLERELAEYDGWVTKPFAPIGSAQSRAQSQRALNDLGYAGGASGTASEITWTWYCPEHREVQAGTPGKCSICGGRLIPSGRKD